MSRTTGRFTDSLFGERLAQRKRMKRRINVKVNVEPQSKKRLDTSEPDEIFHKAVVQALEERNRRLPFRVPVAIRMHFQVGIEKAAPQIDKLPKHYLDLLQAQREQGVAGSPKLLLQDDRLVKALVCTSSLAASPGSSPHVFFEVSTLKDFVQELLLYDRIVNRYRERVPEDIRRLFGSPFSEDLGSTGALREYLQSLKQRDSLKGSYRNFADMMLPSRQEAAQEELLRLREPKPVQFAKIYEGLLNRKYSFPDLTQSVARMLRQVFRVGIATVDLGPPATQKGQSDQFKGRVQKALVKMREKYPVLVPLLTTVGITVVYVPPESGQKIDLDNLAMRVIPYVRLELKPPATLLHALRHYKPGAIDDDMTARLKELHRVDRNQVTRYQVFEIPRLDDDPPEGNVRMMLHGRNEFEDPWVNCRAVVDSWAALPLATEH